MKLLVTGGAGFIAATDSLYVINDPCIAKLVNLDCLTYAGCAESLEDVASNPKYVFEKVDLRDKDRVIEVVKRHNYTRHAPGGRKPCRSFNNGAGRFHFYEYCWNYNLLEACRETWLNSDSRSAAQEVRFHHISTDEVYGSLGPTGLFTEQTPYAPNSPYSASKASSDFLVRAYHHTYGLPCVITNCSNNYGPYQFPEKLIPVVILKVLGRQSIPVYGDGMNVRDWLYVGDHASALWHVLQKGRDGESYNIGGNNEWPNIRIVERICDLIDELKPELGGDSRKLITFVKDRPGHDRRYAIDATKLQQELGWSPAETFETGIRKTVDWYLDNGCWIEMVQKSR